MSDCKTLQCIACNVKNCVHHTTEDTCSAGKIRIGHGEASSSGETCCDTFEKETC